MSGSARNSFVTLIAVIGLALAVTPAAAKKRVVLLKLEGKGGDVVKDAIDEVLQRDNTVISDAAFRRSYGKLKIRKLTDGAYARIAADLSADAVVQGTFTKPGKRWKLAISVREGKTGEEAARLNIWLRAPTPDATVKDDIAAQLLPVIAKATPIIEVEPEPEAQPPPPTSTKKKPDPPVVKKPDPPGPGKKPPVAQPQPQPPPQQPQPEPDSQPAPPPTVVAQTQQPPSPDEPGVTITGGGSPPDPDAEIPAHAHLRHMPVDLEVTFAIAMRNMSFDIDENLPNAQRPSGYKGSPVPAFGITAELYPMAFGSPGSPAAGLGFGVAAERVFLLKSRLGMTTYDTSQTRLQAGARYRINFGDRASLPTLTLGVSWVHLDFTIDHGDSDIGLPNVAYEYVEGSARLRVPIAKWLAMRADVHYLITALGTGEIGDPMQYGKMSTTGLDAEVGFEIRPTPRNLFRLTGRYQFVSHTFDGTGYLTRNRDNDPSTLDVRGAYDEFLAVTLSYGYMF